MFMCSELEADSGSLYFGHHFAAVIEIDVPNDWLGGQGLYADLILLMRAKLPHPHNPKLRLLCFVLHLQDLATTKLALNTLNHSAARADIPDGGQLCEG